MTSDSGEIVQQVQQDFQVLGAYVTGADARRQTAYTVGINPISGAASLGATLWRLFHATRAAVQLAGPVLAPDGMPLGHDEQRSTSCYSV
jgi:hypothetical protein